MARPQKEGAKAVAESQMHLNPNSDDSGALVQNKEGLSALSESASFRDLSKSDQRGFLLLTLLYMLQGMPIGLVFGTMPFLLKAHVGYADLGTFMLSTYPYSLKLLWSPIVDSLYVDAWRVPGTSITLSLGRRKSWIVPIQLLIGAGLLALSYRIDTIIEQSQSGIYTVTAVFFVLIFLAATQDIAVDGWALTLLSEENVGYASTAQTVGINIGYFMSFTVFLALNSVEACNKYLRFRPLSTPILSLAGYLQICGACFLILTLWLLVFQPEKKEKDEDMGVREVYSTIWQICRLRHVQLLLLIHMICKIGFQANDAVTGLKLVEHGLSKEDLAFAVLIDFPFQLVFGYLVAAWSRGRTALRPWLIAFAFRLGCAAASMGIVAGMPHGSKHISTSYFLLIIVSTVMNSFATTVQFVGITAFHTRIADPVIGGTYMTLLNTVSNLGGTWPRYFVLRMVEFFTVSHCSGPTGLDREQIGQMTERVGIPLQLGECGTEVGRSRCESLGGHCVFERDGYYYTSAICITVGVLTLIFFIAPVSHRLQALSPAAWRRPSVASKRA